MAVDVGSRPTPESGVPVRQAPRSAPIKVWASVGAVILAVEIYTIVNYFASGDADRTPKGSSDVPTWMKVSAHTQEVLSCAAALAVIFFFLIRPWRRSGRITTDGLFVIAFALLYWQDPWCNWGQVYITFNSELVNLGNVGPSVPGWVSPNAEDVGEPLLWAGPIYLAWCFMAAVVGSALMRRARDRWPHWTNFRLVALCAVVLMTFVFVCELFWMRLGMYSYPGAVEELTLFYGHYYQLPIYEPIFLGAALTSWAAFRFFKDDKGQTVAERGVETLRISQRQKTGVRFLALYAGINVLYIATYQLPLNFFTQHGGDWPDDIVNRSYLVQNVCGPETGRHCPGGDVPNAKKGTAYISSDGTRLVLPEGAEIPDQTTPEFQPRP